MRLGNMAIEVAPYAPRTVLETLLTELPTSDASGKLDDTTAASLIESLPSLNESLLAARPIWRDIFALTGSLRTFYTPASIINTWSPTCASRQSKDFSLAAGLTRLVQVCQNQ